MSIKVLNLLISFCFFDFGSFLGIFFFIFVQYSMTDTQRNGAYRLAKGHDIEE